MQELRLVAVSEDGSYAVLTAPGRSGRFSLPIDERLRIVARGQFSRLAQYEIEVESPLRPKEIQDRIRAGETAEEIADAAGVPIERVRRFEGPVLAERAYRAQEAQGASIRHRGRLRAGPPAGRGAGRASQRPPGGYRRGAVGLAQAAPTAAGRCRSSSPPSGTPRLAEWVFDPRSRHVTPGQRHRRPPLPARCRPPPGGVPPARVGHGHAHRQQAQPGAGRAGIRARRPSRPGCPLRRARSPRSRTAG